MTGRGDAQDDRSLADALDRVGESAGRAFAWLTLACVLVCFAVVVLRYGFNLGYIWMQELYVWLHAIVFTGCAGYALKHDKHVRVDVFYARMSERGRIVGYPELGQWGPESLSRNPLPTSDAQELRICEFAGHPDV